MSEIPAPQANDTDDVVLALQIAKNQWDKGDRAEALKWLRKAADSAFDGGDDRRGIELSKLAAELTAKARSAPAPMIAPPVPGPSPAAVPPPVPGGPPARVNVAQAPLQQHAQPAAPRQVAAVMRQPGTTKAVMEPEIRRGPSHGASEAPSHGHGAHKPLTVHRPAAEDDEATREITLKELMLPSMGEGRGAGSTEEWSTESLSGDELSEVLEASRSINDDGAASPAPAVSAVATPVPGLAPAPVQAPIAAAPVPEPEKKPQVREPSVAAKPQAAKPAIAAKAPLGGVKPVGSSAAKSPVGAKPASESSAKPLAAKPVGAKPGTASAKPTSEALRTPLPAPVPSESSAQAAATSQLDMVPSTHALRVAVGRVGGAVTVRVLDEQGLRAGEHDAMLVGLVGDLRELFRS